MRSFFPRAFRAGAKTGLPFDGNMWGGESASAEPDVATRPPDRLLGEPLELVKWKYTTLPGYRRDQKHTSDGKEGGGQMKSF